MLEAGLDAAYRRAMANAEWKAQARGKFGPLGESLADTRLHPVRVCRDTVAALYEVDPRTMDIAEMTRFTREISARVKGFHASLGYNYVSTMTQLARELFASSEGALIDQSFALTQGLCYVVANGVGNSQGDLRRPRPPARLGDPPPRRERPGDVVPALRRFRSRHRARRGGAQHRPVPRHLAGR